MADLYRIPAVYAAAFARDVAGEVDGLLALHRRYGPGHPPRRALEVACGPADHAIELARRGLSVTALDRAASMCAHARTAARRAGVVVDVVRADMRRFSLGRRADFALCALDSLGHLHDLVDLVAHLGAVRDHLRPAGVYVTETAHPAEFLTPTGGAPRGRDRWRSTRDGVRAEVRWRTTRLDPVTQVADERIRVRVADGRWAGVHEATIRLRRWTPAELEAAAGLAGGLELVARHGRFDPAVAFDDGPDAVRLVSVFRRVAGRSAQSSSTRRQRASTNE